MHTSQPASQHTLRCPFFGRGRYYTCAYAKFEADLCTWTASRNTVDVSRLAAACPICHYLFFIYW